MFPWTFPSIFMAECHSDHMVMVWGGRAHGRCKDLNAEALTGTRVPWLSVYCKLVLFSSAQLNGLTYSLVLTKLTCPQNMWLNKVAQRNCSLKRILIMKAHENFEPFGSHTMG